MFYLPHTPPTPPQLIYFPFLIFPFIFNFHPRLHRTHIDPARTHTDPTLNFFFPPPHYVDHLGFVDCVPFGQSKTDF